MRPAPLSHRTVPSGQIDAVQYREIGASRHGLAHRLEHGCPIVGMNALDERLEGSAKRAGLQAVLGLQGLGPLERPRSA